MKTDEFQCLFLMYQRKLPLKNLEKAADPGFLPKVTSEEHFSIYCTAKMPEQPNEKLLFNLLTLKNIKGASILVS